MASRSFLLSLMALSGNVLADTHSMFSGFFAGNDIVALEFDDSTSTLSLVNNISTAATSGSKWISLDHTKKNLYVATTGSFQSYAVTSDLGLEYKSSVNLSSSCPNANFIAASNDKPYTVFGTPYSTGCSTLVMSVDEEGSLVKAFSTLDYNNSSGVHGTSLSSAGDFIYSADDMGNGVWVHNYNNISGQVLEWQHIEAPEGADPRHLEHHPAGYYVYVLYEASSEIAVYSRNAMSGMLTDTNITYSLLPEGFTNSSSYWADEVLLSVPAVGSTPTRSATPKYLVTATRSRDSSKTGYISVFSVADDGAIIDQLFLIPSTASGGSANAVSPALFSEEYFAITDSAANFVEMWKIETDSDNATSASAVAHLDLAAGPANVVWLN